MPKTRHTLWMDMKNLKGHDRYTSKNPKFRVWMMFIAIVVVVVGMVLIFVFMPGSSSQTIHFSSIPAGASVFVDGEISGTTPFSTDLENGKYQLRVEAEGYLPIEKSIEVSTAKTSFNIIFEDGERKIAFTSNPDGVDIFINNEYVGKTPFVFRDNGYKNTVSVKAQKTGYTSIQVIKNLETAEKVHLSLEQIMLKISINSDPPAAELFINRKHVGQTPWNSILPFGTHKIRLAKEGGFEPVDETIDLSADMEIVFPLGDKGVNISGKSGENSIPGAQIFLLPVTDGAVKPDVIPLKIIGTTPAKVEMNTIATYLSLDDASSRLALFVGIRPGVSASFNLINVNNFGEIKTNDIQLNFPESSQTQVLGQSLNGINWFSLLSETVTPAGYVKNIPQFTVKGDRVINRDNPDVYFKLSQNGGTIILSQDHKYLAQSINGKITVYNISKELYTVNGTNPVFDTDGDVIIFTEQKNVYKLELQSGKISEVKIPFSPTSLVHSSNFIIAFDKNDNFVVVDTKTMTISSWLDLLEAEKNFWAASFVPESIFTRNITGEDHVLLLGKVFGVKVIISVDNQPALLGVWFDNSPAILMDILR